MNKNDIKKMQQAVAESLKFLEENQSQILAAREYRAQHNLSAINYWLPFVQNLGLNLPKTKLYYVSLPDQLALLEGQVSAQLSQTFETIKNDAQNMGTKKWFIKNALFSGKHNWTNTCCLEDLAKIQSHVAAITEMAYMVGCEESLYLVLREWIPTNYDFTAFGGMPVTKERRYFIENGRVTFHHPYWPPKAISEPSRPDFLPLLEQINFETQEEIKELTHLSLKVSQALPGAWSVDWLQSKDGKWYLIDMAEKSKSYIWQDYKKN